MLYHPFILVKVAVDLIDLIDSGWFRSHHCYVASVESLRKVFNPQLLSGINLFYCHILMAKALYWKSKGHCFRLHKFHCWAVDETFNCLYTADQK